MTNIKFQLFIALRRFAKNVIIEYLKFLTPLNTKTNSNRQIPRNVF